MIIFFDTKHDKSIMVTARVFTHPLFLYQHYVCISLNYVHVVACLYINQRRNYKHLGYKLEIKEAAHGISKLFYRVTFLI